MEDLLSLPFPLLVVVVVVTVCVMGVLLTWIIVKLGLVRSKEPSPLSDPMKGFKVIEIGDCEYIINKRELDYFTHKGDCKNPIHCHNQKKENKQ